MKTLEFFLDVDGVILDFEKSFMDMLRELYMPDLPQGYLPRTWDMGEEFPEVNMDEAWKEFVGSDRFKSIHPLVSSEVFNNLSENSPVYLITNIPENLIESRLENLSQYELQHDGVYIGGHWDFGVKDYPSKSEQIARLHQNGNQIVFMDDHPTNCKDVKAAFPDSEVFLMSRPHNKNEEDQIWKRVSDWEDFLKKTIGINL